ncbi:hypothetical protein [Glaciimonas soli]|nr:hypothetical protein [Glaciimonas soli]
MATLHNAAMTQACKPDEAQPPSIMTAGIALALAVSRSIVE